MLRKTLRPRRLALGSGIFLLVSFSSISAVLQSCGKFEAYKHPDSTQLVWTINPNPIIVAEPSTIIPIPLPSLPRGAPAAQPLPRDPNLQPQLVVPGASTADIDRRTSALGFISVVPDMTQLPFSSVGRLTYNFPNDAPGTGHSCTAQLIGPHGVALTAAHCVYDKDNKAWAFNVRFRLRFNGIDNTDAGDFGWQCTAIVSGWVNGLYPFDFAFIRLRGTPPRGIGLEINAGAGSVVAVGYPAANPWNALQMTEIDNNKDGNNPSAMANPMGIGSSGGGWIRRANNATVSLNSFFYNDTPDTMNGPELSATTLKIYDFVARDCNDAIPSAMGSEAVAFKSSKPTADTEMAPISESVSSGVWLNYEASASCPCENAQAVFLNNTTKGFRLVGVQHIQTTGGIDNTTSSTDYLSLRPGEKRAIGCRRSEAAAICNVDHQYRIASDRAVASLTPDRPKEIAGASLAASLAVSDISQCVAKCARGDAAACLDLGQGAITALAPLGKFVERVDTGSGMPEGAIVEKKEIITEYGGDPNKDEDPCARTSVGRVGETILNKGLACRVRTKSLFPKDDFRTRLTMQPVLEGIPSAWNSALSGALLNAPSTLFPDRTKGPFIDFEGADSELFNTRYGGDIYAIQAVSNKQIVLATSNGCLQGAYKR